MGLVENLTQVRNKLEDNRASLETYCNNNGIEVRENADLATLITAIEAVGGTSGGRAVTTGSFTPSSDTEGMTITHNLGEVPYFFMIFNTTKNGFTASPSSAFSGAWGFSEKPNGANYYQWVLQGSTYSAWQDLITATGGKKPLGYANETTIQTRQNTYPLMAGVVYYWFAIGK